MVQREGYKGGSEDHLFLLHNDIFKRGSAGPFLGSRSFLGQGSLSDNALKAAWTGGVVTRKRGQQNHLLFINYHCKGYLEGDAKSAPFWDDLECQSAAQMGCIDMWQPGAISTNLCLQLDAKHFRHRGSCLPEMTLQGYAHHLVLLHVYNLREAVKGPLLWVDMLINWHTGTSPADLFFLGDQYSFLLVGEIKDIFPCNIVCLLNSDPPVI